jgi:hypothetical protein
MSANTYKEENQIAWKVGLSKEYSMKFWKKKKE